MRDDIDKLNMPDNAKRYARRKGLASMQRQPHDALKVNATLYNFGKVFGFKNRDAGGQPKLSMNTNFSVPRTARRVVDSILESPTTQVGPMSGPASPKEDLDIEIVRDVIKDALDGATDGLLMRMIPGGFILQTDEGHFKVEITRVR